MADKNLSNTAAEDTVFENLGLTRADLGIEDQGSGNEDLDQGSGNEDLDQGSGQEDFQFGDIEDQQQQRQPTRDQQSRVSHTDSRLPQGAEVKADAKGNLVNAQGQIVARAGKEARLYQDLHKTRQQVQGFERRINDAEGRVRKAVEIGRGLHERLTTLQAQADSVKQFGLDQGEHLTALRLFKELRDNPQAAIKNILTRAATNGINVAELGLTPGGIDSKSLIDVIRQELGSAMNPLRESTEAARKAKEVADRQEARTREVQGEVANFFDSNPDARQYLPVFTQTIQKFPGMTLGEVWARIQLQLATNPRQGRTNSQRPNGRPRSLPNGRGAPMNGGDGDIAPVTESYDAIIQKAMREAGMTN